MTLGEKLQRLRKGNAMSQEQLAVRMEVSRQAVSKWETGESLPDTEKIIKLSRMFHVSTDYLLYDELEELPDPPKEQGPVVADENPGRHGGRDRALTITGTVFGGIGGLGVLVIWVLSTMIESRVSTATTDAGGTTWYSSAPGFSFGGFVEMFHLKAVLGICLFCLALGAGLLIYRLYRSLGQASKK